MLLRHIGRDQAEHLWSRNDFLASFLDGLSDAICAHIDDLKAIGVTGYFHATNAATPFGKPRGMNDDIYALYVRPYDLKILRAAQGMIRVLHAHGSGIELSRLQSYPFEVVHISDRDRDNPSLGELLEWTNACVMGGIDESSFSSDSRAKIAAQMDDAMKQTGGRRFILAPGCVIPSSSSGASLQFMRYYFEQRMSSSERVTGPRVLKALKNCSSAVQHFR